MIQSMHHSVSWWCTIRQLWNCKSKYSINSYPFIIFVAGKASGILVKFLVFVCSLPWNNLKTTTIKY